MPMTNTSPMTQTQLQYTEQNKRILMDQIIEYTRMLQRLGLWNSKLNCLGLRRT